MLTHLKAILEELGVCCNNKMQTDVHCKPIMAVVMSTFLYSGKNAELQSGLAVNFRNWRKICFFVLFCFVFVFRGFYFVYTHTCTMWKFCQFGLAKNSFPVQIRSFSWKCDFHIMSIHKVMIRFHPTGGAQSVDETAKYW